MLTVAPTGSTKRVTRLSTPLFSSRHLNVIGRVAALKTKKVSKLKKGHGGEFRSLAVKLHSHSIVIATPNIVLSSIRFKRNRKTYAKVY